DGVDTRRDRIATVALEALEILSVFSQRAFARVVLQLLGLDDERLLELEQLGELPGGRFPHGGRVAEVAVLLQERDADAGLPGDLPTRRLHLAGEQAEQRRLAGAVAANDP